MFERRRLLVFLGNTYNLERRDLSPLFLFSPVKYPRTGSFPSKTLFSWASDVGAPTAVNIATAGIDPATTEAQENLLFHLQGSV